jgi:hypothetical protein
MAGYSYGQAGLAGQREVGREPMAGRPKRIAKLQAECQVTAALLMIDVTAQTRLECF